MLTRRFLAIITDDGGKQMAGVFCGNEREREKNGLDRGLIFMMSFFASGDG